MKFRHVFLATAIAIIAAPLTASAAPELAPHASSFVAGNGITIVVAPTADNKAALLRVDGVNHPIDNVVFLAEKATVDRRTFLTITFDGKPFSLVVSEDGSSWYRSGAKAFLPGADTDGAYMYYDEKATRALDLKALANAYDKQMTDGIQARLAAFDKDKALAKIAAASKQHDEDTARSCGVTIKTTIDMATISEDQIKHLGAGIGGLCGVVATSAEQLCSGNGAEKDKFKTWLGAHTEITCQFGEKLKLSVDGARILFTTSETAPNQVSFATQFLRNQ